MNASGVPSRRGQCAGAETTDTQQQLQGQDLSSSCRISASVQRAQHLALVPRFSSLHNQALQLVVVHGPSQYCGGCRLDTVLDVGLSR